MVESDFSLYYNAQWSNSQKKALELKVLILVYSPALPYSYNYVTRRSPRILCV